MPEPAPLWVRLSAATIRRMPFGRYRVAHALGRVPAAPFLMRLPPDAGHHLFVCDLRDSISREVCFTGQYEPQETQLAELLLRPGMTAIDAGAHWGYFTLVCAHRVGGQGRVLSLEPDARLLALLAANVAANGLRHVEWIGAAAAAGRGSARFAGFREADGNWGTSRVVSARVSADCEVPTISIDELVEERGWAAVDLVKIDVEGSEGDVLRGMADGLRAGRYRHVLLEGHPLALAERGLSFDMCVEPLRAARYRGWLIDHSADMHRRAAAGSVPPSELLRPLEGVDLAAQPWPHMLWSAPSAAAPV